jgi:hypothetical protein
MENNGNNKKTMKWIALDLSFYIGSPNHKLPFELLFGVQINWFSFPNDTM